MQPRRIIQWENGEVSKPQLEGTDVKVWFLTRGRGVVFGEFWSEFPSLGIQDPDPQCETMNKYTGHY